ncbi:MAG: OmpH family outer membrane protein [Gallionella sp.]
MKTIIKVGFLAVLLSAGIVQAGEALNVGVVNLERVVRESVPAMKAEKRIEKEFYTRDQELKKLMNEARDLQLTLEKKAETLTDSERRSKERELSALSTDLQRMQREFGEDLNLRKNEELATVLELSNKAIQAIAETGKYDLILQEAVYRNPKLDITDEVIRYLEENSRLAK